ncbi:MAG: DNA-binding protein [Acidiphilium sp. 37-67-22]|nr:MAG: DNA-binding protein [Acidiphilium sp. 37-67-22]HQT72739.1 ribbon-helix-helix domain-containing protein [Acidiphilium sp.]
MCNLLQGQNPGHFAQTSRSIRLAGRSTSVRLEGVFWTALGEIAAAEGVSVPRLIALLHDEGVDRLGDIGNLASLLRAACILYRRRGV